MSFGPKVLVSVVTVLSLPTFRLLILAVEALNLQARARLIRSPKLITNIDLGVFISPTHFYKCIFGNLNPKLPAGVSQIRGSFFLKPKSKPTERTDRFSIVC